MNHDFALCSPTLEDRSLYTSSKIVDLGAFPGLQLPFHHNDENDESQAT